MAVDLGPLEVALVILIRLRSGALLGSRHHLVPSWHFVTLPTVEEIGRGC